jgi:hypothetical protein
MSETIGMEMLLSRSTIAQLGGPRSASYHARAMSDLSPRSANRPSRQARQQRAYRLATTGGAAGVVFVVGVVLAIVGIVGAWLPILALLVAIACGFMFRRTVS